MTPQEIKKFFEVYPEATIYKADKRYFLQKDKGLAEDHARAKEVEIEVITAKTKLDNSDKKAADEAAKKAADEAAKKAADEAAKAAEGTSGELDKK